jgi:16S rRNA (cytosine967-C5)-methyltransferase
LSRSEGAAPDRLAARRFAVAVIEDVVRRRLPMDDQLEKLARDPAFAALSVSDRGLVRAITHAAIRRLGTIRMALAERLAKGLPPKAGRLEAILIAGVAQIVELGVAPHAAVDTAVELAREDAHARHFADLANAVLRRISEAKDSLASADPLAVDTPEWLRRRWVAVYGAETAAAIARAHRLEPGIDLTVKADAAAWADSIGGEVLPTGSLRLTSRMGVRQLPGFAEGAWWVQDVAAALPARLMGDVAGQHVLDMCAAPGGKTAQLAHAGAAVTALDRSAPRMQRLTENMERLGLAAETVVGDALTYDALPFDAVLLDAPCSATGTIRRHPDVAWSRTMEDLFKLAALQAKLLDRAATLVRPGGCLVYATCSLEPEEGEQQVERFLARRPDFTLDPVRPEEVGSMADLISPVGHLRSLPCHLPNAVDRMAGMDGFFAARLVRHDR